jgi:hypothetical protein
MVHQEDSYQVMIELHKRVEQFPGIQLHYLIAEVYSHLPEEWTSNSFGDWK